MSDDAFALTPAPAQPPQPSEAVYQALNAALSATSRGRWFLSEFAKRNRNAESSKMLDAVARIEQAVAVRPALSASGSDLEIARTWALAARAHAANLIASTDREAALTAHQRGLRIIREIAQSMRAVGNDPRICNILDTQLDAIETAQKAADTPFEGVLAAFDRLLAQLDEVIPRSIEAEPTTKSLAKVEVVDVDATVKLLTSPDPAARLAAVADLAAACATGDTSIEPTAVDDGEDDALLQQIALEMAAPDDDGLVKPATPATPAATPAPATGKAESKPDTEKSAPERPSLGQALLAQGLVQTPPKFVTDPFAPLKKLTQAEKIALFT